MSQTWADGARTVRLDDLRGRLLEACQALGFSPEHAAEVADVLLDYELRGHESHGVHMIGWLMDSVRSQGLNPRPNVRVLHETEATLLLEGDRGHVTGPMQAMRWCVARARRPSGLAVAGVRNAQVIVPGYLVRVAAEAGLVAFACTNGTPMVAPPGGLTRSVGTNPFGYGVPAGRHPPIVLDIASTSGAAYKVRLAAQGGEPVPEGWILDAAGRSTTDASAFDAGGFMAPLGSPSAPHKGFGLALIVDILGGVLSGAASGRGVGDAPFATGTFMWALDPEAFMPRREFLDRVEALIEEVKAGQRMEGAAELLVPGERGARRRDELVADGLVPLSGVTWDRLTGTLRALSVALPTVVGASGA